MRVSRLFAGLLIIVLGVALVLSNFDVLRLDWHFIFRLWPVLLVFAGISVLVPNQKWRAVLYAVTSVLVLAWIISAASVGWGNVKGLFSGDRRSLHTQEFSQAFDKNTRHGVLTLNDGGGTFTINGTSADNLIEATAQSDIGDYIFKTDKSGRTMSVNLKYEEGNNHWRWGVKNTLDMRLNPAADWTIDASMGACKVDFDLSPFKVTSADIKAGASKIKIRLGNKADTTNLNFDTGASSLVVYLPASSGCQIKDQAEMSTKSFPGFVKGDDGYYTSSNFSTARKKIFMDVNAGVSSIKVLTY